MESLIKEKKARYSAAPTSQVRRLGLQLTVHLLIVLIIQFINCQKWVKKEPTVIEMDFIINVYNIINIPKPKYIQFTMIYNRVKHTILTFVTLEKQILDFFRDEWLK